MPSDADFRARLRALADLIADSDTTYEHARVQQFPMPWGKPGVLKVRLSKEGGHDLIVRFTRKVAGDSLED
jgi:hypothetical protein